MGLLIVGASARAAAYSALRAGLVPVAVDLFGDRDLAAVARCVRLEPSAYPSGIVDAAVPLPRCPWSYTGALENHPSIVAEMSSRRPLWGNSAATLRAVRDPEALCRAVRSAGLFAPEVRLEAAGLPRDGSWLRKPRDSAGGRGIEPLREGDPVSPREPTPPRPTYYQRRIDGRSISAVYVGHRAGAELCGLSLQLTGVPGARFAYRGSLAPWPVEVGVRSRITDLGTALVEVFGLIGLFGVDLVLRGETPWVVEVNPRYTASVEVLELAYRAPLLAAHREACEGRAVGGWSPHGPVAGFVAKEVVFATVPSIFPDDAIAFTRDDPIGYLAPEVADLPWPGTRFRPGEPVLTVLARGTTPTLALRAVAAARRRWSARLRPAR